MLKNTIKTVHVGAERALKIKRKSFGKCLSFIYKLMCSRWESERGRGGKEKGNSLSAYKCRVWRFQVPKDCENRPERLLICVTTNGGKNCSFVEASERQNMKNARWASWLMEPKIRSFFNALFFFCPLNWFRIAWNKFSKREINS